jgi:hypothetical protein
MSNPSRLQNGESQGRPEELHVVSQHQLLAGDSSRTPSGGEGRSHAWPPPHRLQPVIARPSIGWAPYSTVSTPQAALKVARFDGYAPASRYSSMRTSIGNCPRGYPKTTCPPTQSWVGRLFVSRVAHLVGVQASWTRTSSRASRLDVQEGASYTEPSAFNRRWRCENNRSCRIQT